MAKTLKGIASYYISNIHNFDALAELESQSDRKYELANLDFSTPTLNVKPKKLLLDIKLLQNLPNGTKVLQSLPNGKKILQIYQMEGNIGGGCRTPYTPSLNPTMGVPIVLMIRTDTYGTHNDAVLCSLCLGLRPIELNTCLELRTENVAAL